MGSEEAVVLVTSFGPFGVHAENPTEAVAAALAKDGLPGARLLTHAFSVSYQDVAEALPRLWDELRPALVVHLGVYTRGVVAVERGTFARGFCLPDIHGDVPLANAAVPRELTGDQLELHSPLDVDAIVQAVRSDRSYEDLGVEVEASSDPGRFLCGFSYAVSLGRGLGGSVGPGGSAALFVHVPMRERRPVEASTAAVRAVLRAALAQLHSPSPTPVLPAHQH